MIKKTILSLVRSLGYDVVRHERALFPPDFNPEHIKIIETVAPYTICPPLRIHALVESVKYIVKNDIEGDLVECGVAKGGTMMAIALTLIAEGIMDRNLYLFDTFAGMPAPEEIDADFRGVSALEIFSGKKISEESLAWRDASVDSVKEAMSLTGYPTEKIHYVKGLVEKTIPEEAPTSIALLRLDTVFYRSTIHELKYLYPLVNPKGIVIVDDYGHFMGVRAAVNEYFDENRFSPLLNRIDYTGRLIIKED